MQPSVSLIRHKGAGFTALPRALLDMLLCSDLTKRELLILLMVARLTYGCKGAGWARVRQADLFVVGIGANHAQACLQALLARGLLVQNGAKNEYRLDMEALQPNAVTAARLSRLSSLVSLHLGSTSLNGKEVVPKPGTLPFPNQEEMPSPIGKPADRATWRFSRSHSRFVKTNEDGIDR